MLRFIDVVFMESRSIDAALNMECHCKVKQWFSSPVVGIPCIFVIVDTQFHVILLWGTERSVIETDVFNALGRNLGAKIRIGFGGDVLAAGRDDINAVFIQIKEAGVNIVYINRNMYYFYKTY